MIAHGAREHDFLLRSFLDRVVSRLQLRHNSPATMDQYGVAVDWLARALQREPLVSDLNRPTLTTFFGALADCGLSRHMIRMVRSKVAVLWKLAAELGIAPACDLPALPPAPGVERTWQQAEPADGTLLAYYRRVFRPRVACDPRCGRSMKWRYDSAVTAFHDFCGRQLELADVTPELVDQFARWLTVERPDTKTAGDYPRALRRILRTHNAEHWPVYDGPPPRIEIGQERQASRLHAARKRPPPHGEPGTLLHYWHTVYRPQAMLTQCRGSVESCATFFRLSRQCFGYDLALAELSAARLAEFLHWAKMHRGNKPGRLAALRRVWLMVWRHAERNGQAPHVPPMKPIRVGREVPDAWSLDELAGIIDAAGRLDRSPIQGIPAPLYWRALLLVGYWTALRRRALFGLRSIDVDWETGWIEAPAHLMKNGRAKRFRLGADAIAALEAIRQPSRTLLFPAAGDGKHLRKHFKAILTAAGVAPSRHPLPHFHKLRRTTLTHTAVRAGIAAAVELAGHSARHVTERYLDPRFLPGQDATEWLPALNLESMGACDAPQTT